MRKKLRIVKKLQDIVTLAFIAAFIIFVAGTCGALETDSIGFAQAFIQFIAGLGVCALCLLGMRALESFRFQLEKAIENNDIIKTRNQMQWDRYFRTGDF